ncbi:hypothetical protein JHK85_006179 [Glycine max]|nr:hypothetical protein JHK85_006179 [Glycine max]KAG5070807.1 hypothetical protein JHK86_006018 [Glycine max]KHN42209.1 Putative ripening-related protein 5 [Glycine soja]
MKMSNSIASFVLLLILISTNCLCSEAQQCRPSGRIMGKKPPPGECNKENDSDCCVQGKAYTTYKCSPAVSRHTKAELTLNSFEKGGDGGGPSECDNQYHSDDTPVVALSTGWFNDRSRCLHNITISGNGKSVVAMVVDECDSTMGCDEDHDYQPPCSNNIVDASKAVWKALDVDMLKKLIFMLSGTASKLEDLQPFAGSYIWNSRNAEIFNDEVWPIWLLKSKVEALLNITPEDISDPNQREIKGTLEVQGDNCGASEQGGEGEHTCMAHVHAQGDIHTFNFSGYNCRYPFFRVT